MFDYPTMWNITIFYGCFPHRQCENSDYYGGNLESMMGPSHGLILFASINRTHYLNKKMCY